MLQYPQEIYKHNHIVFASDNFNTLSLVRELGEAKINPIWICCVGVDINLTRSSRYVDQIIDVTSEEESLSALLRYSDPLFPPFVYTTDDNNECLLDKYYDLLEGKFYFFNAGSAGRLTDLMDKQKLCEYAERFGFRIPKGEVLSPGQLPQNLKFPVYTKTLTPYSKGWKRDHDVFKTSDDLLAAYKGMISEKLLIQEYVDKKDEIEIYGISIDAGREIYMPCYSRQLRMTHNNIGAYKSFEVFSDDVLSSKIKLLIQEIGFSGIFEAEFIKSKDDELFFLEVNFRFPLSHYACYSLGYNLPLMWASGLLSNHIELSSTPRKNQLIFMNEPSDFQRSVRLHQVSFLHWLRDLIKADEYILFNWKDIVPLFAFYIHKMKKKFKSLSRWHKC